MEETPKKLRHKIECETEHDKENSDNSNSEQSDDNDGKHYDDDSKYDVNSTKNTFSLQKNGKKGQ